MGTYVPIDVSCCLWRLDVPVHRNRTSMSARAYTWHTPTRLLLFIDAVLQLIRHVTNLRLCDY